MSSVSFASWSVVMLGVVVGLAGFATPGPVHAAARSVECVDSQPPQRRAPGSMREYKGLADKLKAADPKDYPQGIELANVVVDEPLDLHQSTIDVPVSFRHVVFTRSVTLAESHFPHGLNIRNSIFLDEVDLSGAHVDGALALRGARFAQAFDAGRITVTGFLNIRDACFWQYVDISDSRVTSGLDARDARFFAVKCMTDDGRPFACADFSGMRIEGTADIRRTRFLGWTDWSETTIAGSLLAQGATFVGTQSGSHIANLGYMTVRGPTAFGGASFATGVSFAHSSFTSLDLTATFKPPVSLDGMVYAMMVAPNAPGRRNEVERSIALLRLAEYNASNYTTLEAMFQRQGYPEWANEVYVARKARERTEGRLSGLAVVWNWILWAFMGYGRRPWLAWIWSLGFVVAGAFLFRSDRMVAVGQERPRPYHPLWYSLDVFAPVIDLGVAKAWMPDWHHHPWLAAGSYLWRLAGWFLVPLGLAAWTGLVK